MKKANIGLGLIVRTILIAAVTIFLVSARSPTGLFVADKENTYAETFGHVVNKFFDIEAVYFPPGICTSIVEEIYAELAGSRIDVTRGIETTGNEKLATMNFVVNRIMPYGTLDMVKGTNLIDSPVMDSFISISAEMVAHTTRSRRLNYYTIDLFGKTNGLFYVEKGKLATPSVDCYFATKNGDTLCSCKAHTITGIAVAGITSGLTAEESSKVLSELSR